MPEPSVTGSAMAATAITLSGTVIGIHFDTLLAGFAGGLIALSLTPGALSAGRVAGTLLGSTLLAGFLAQIAALGAFEFAPWTRPLGDFMRVSAAGCLGILAQALIPMAIDWIRKRASMDAPNDTKREKEPQ